jgi:hypothetical protein
VSDTIGAAGVEECDPNIDADDRCFYCDRDDQFLEQCCGRHPGDLVCADRAGCRDFILAALKAAGND